MSVSKNKINKVKKSVYLNDLEKDIMDNAVLTYMEDNDIKDKSMKNNFNVLFSSGWTKKLAYTALTIVILFSAGAGTVFASKEALPGDLLYSVKVNVTEEIKSALISSVEGKADWEVERLELRLDEITKLVEKTGSISQTLLQDTEKEIKEQTEKVAEAAKNLEVLGEHDAIYILLDRIQGSLETYNEVLEGLIENNVDITADEVDRIIEEVEQTEQSVKEVQFKIVSVENKEDINEEVEGSSIFEFLSIKGGEVLQKDELYPILWSSKINNETYLSIQLLDNSNNLVGQVSSLSKRGIDYARKPDRVSDLKWNPKYVYNESVGSSVEVSEGEYRFKMIVQTDDEKNYYIFSNSFNIEEKTKPVVVPSKKITFVTPDKNSSYRVGEQYEITWDATNIAQGTFGYLSIWYPSGEKKKDLLRIYDVTRGSVVWDVKDILPGTWQLRIDLNKDGSGYHQESDIFTMAPYEISPLPDLVEIDEGENLPDLTINKASISNFRPGVEEEVEIEFEVKNIGNKTYEAKHTFGVEIMFNDEIISRGTSLGDGCAYDPSIDPGQICTVSVKFVPEEAGKYYVKVFAKYHILVPELKRENNSEVLNFTVENRYPDLSVTNIEYDLGDVVLGEYMPIIFNVENIGEGDYKAKRSFGIEIKYASTGNIVFADKIITDGACAYNPTIFSGQNCTVSTGFTPEESGEYVVKVTSAYREHTPEVSADNNSKTVYFTIEEKLPDMEVKNITFSPAELVAGSPVEVTYEVENIGAVRYFSKHTFALKVGLNGVLYYDSTSPLADSCAYDEGGTAAGKICTVKYEFVPIRSGEHEITAYMKNYFTEEVRTDNNSESIFITVE